MDGDARKSQKFHSWYRTGCQWRRVQSLYIRSNGERYFTWPVDRDAQGIETKISGMEKNLTESSSKINIVEFCLFYLFFKFN